MDLGTNTFHLLIAQGNIPNYQEIVHLHEAVKLGEGGINKGIIQPVAFDRGIAAMQKFKHIIEGNGISEVKAIATSALRNASNGSEFIDQVKNNTGITIEIIDGDSEANYIYQGIRASGCLNSKTSLIMDIGGVSVEFILSNDRQIFWKQSFEIGAARLMDKFNQVDPIPQVSINELNSYLDNALTDLFNATKNTDIYKLIGSSGAFETFAELIEINKGNEFDLAYFKAHEFNTNELISITDVLISSNHQERAANKGIISVRVDMIVVASLITRYVMQKLAINKVCMSTYSLKEGILVSIIG